MAVYVTDACLIFKRNYKKPSMAKTSGRACSPMIKTYYNNRNWDSEILLWEQESRAGGKRAPEQAHLQRDMVYDQAMEKSGSCLVNRDPGGKYETGCPPHTRTHTPIPEQTD